MTRLPECRRIGDDCLELSLFGGVGAASEIARLEGATAIAIDQRRHLLLNFQGRNYVDPVLVDTIAAERIRLADARLDLTEFGATGVARQILKNARADREGRIPAPRRAGRSPRMLPWPAGAR